MPRIKQNAARYAAADFQREVKLAIVRDGLKGGVKGLSRETGIEYSRLWRLLRDPQHLTAGELGKIKDAIPSLPYGAIDGLMGIRRVDR